MTYNSLGQRTGFRVKAFATEAESEQSIARIAEAWRRPPAVH